MKRHKAAGEDNLQALIQSTESAAEDVIALDALQKWARDGEKIVAAAFELIPKEARDFTTRRDVSLAATNTIHGEEKTIKAWTDDWMETNLGLTEYHLASSYVRGEPLDPVRLACNLVVVKSALEVLLERLPTRSTGKAVDAADARWRHGTPSVVIPGRSAPMKEVRDKETGEVAALIQEAPRPRTPGTKLTKRQIANALGKTVEGLTSRRKRRRSR